MKRENWNKILSSKIPEVICEEKGKKSAKFQLLKESISEVKRQVNVEFFENPDYKPSANGESHSSSDNEEEEEEENLEATNVDPYTLEAREKVQKGSEKVNDSIEDSNESEEKEEAPVAQNMNMQGEEKESSVSSDVVHNNELPAKSCKEIGIVFDVLQQTATKYASNFDLSSMNAETKGKGQSGSEHGKLNYPYKGASDMEYLNMSKHITPELSNKQNHKEEEKDEEEQTLSSSAHVTNKPYNFNSEFQTFIDALRFLKEQKDIDVSKEILFVNSSIIRLATSFASCAKRYGKIIISEMHLSYDSKTIKPSNTGGLIGGEKYIVQNILFKFALDAGFFDGDHSRAAKVAGHELKGLQAYYSAETKQLHFPLVSNFLKRFSILFNFGKKDGVD